MALSQEQQAGLWKAKLSRLARENLGRDKGIHHGAPWGAALEHAGVWTALLEVAPERTFGQALVLAARNDAQSLDVLVENNAGAVARRARLFEPPPTVWQVVDTDLTIAEASVIESIEPAPIEPRVAELLQVAEVDVIVEHGVTIGECRGLEVARVNGAGAEQRLSVGVGAYDQGAFEVMHPDLTPKESLAEVVAQVLTYRRRGGEPHPINRLARERWVRSELLADPAIVGCTTLTPVEPATAREGIKDVAIASAVGVTTEGDHVLVACSVGIDLDAVPSAAVLADTHAADRIMMVLPDRDRHSLVDSIAERSRRPIEFVTAPQPWAEVPRSE